MARRIRSGEWLTRDLVLTDMENTITLSGPGTITGNLEPGLHETILSDGLRLAEDWATMIYVVDDNEDIVNHGVVLPPTAYEEAARITCGSVSVYPQGYIFNESKLWGPQAAVKAKPPKAAKPEIARPDPVAIFHDHWEWIQDQHASDLSVDVEGHANTKDGGTVSKVLIGNYAEPYRLRKWDAPNLGSEMDTLAQITPFDYVDSARWTNDDHLDVEHVVTIGYPRLGRKRDDLRFAMGENIALVPAVQTVEGFANHLIGLGNGEAGPSMAYKEVAWDDGRLRRTRVMTDKTATEAVLERRLAIYQQALSQRYDVTQVAILDHENARISEIQLGDDIRVLAEHPEYGPIDLWVRVLSISRGDSDHAAVLTTSASVFFIYKPTEEFS